MDQGNEAAASLHFNQDIVSLPDQQAFIAALLRGFAQVIPDAA